VVNLVVTGGSLIQRLKKSLRCLQGSIPRPSQTKRL